MEMHGAVSDAMAPSSTESRLLCFYSHDLHMVSQTSPTMMHGRGRTDGARTE